MDHESMAQAGGDSPLPRRGDFVVVTGGRKITKGTGGRVIWCGESNYGTRVGFVTADEQTLYTAVKNVTVMGRAVVATPEPGLPTKWQEGTLSWLAKMADREAEVRAPWMFTFRCECMADAEDTLTVEGAGLTAVKVRAHGGHRTDVNMVRRSNAAWSRNTGRGVFHGRRTAKCTGCGLPRDKHEMDTFGVNPKVFPMCPVKQEA